jgi:hypothetical protein
MVNTLSELTHRHTELLQMKYILLKINCEQILYCMNMMLIPMKKTTFLSLHNVQC